ncbi:hypothetical protein L198_04206 [Cryptococcus wingfieldii CBS 7118]|uniref:Cep57 centrosome microtubule-binding domain-containing protein n=1 Tax=Cryptococcus wingfieldii CBS 7118 TaxID=1295528 RepID=A0A1E3J6M3_9TREE|nr:hypothetical protein L198_04206 [Cryptococcus wingfieldii CBS 7118]ODN96492.1 hypothetical protein L198_04206 [Cryptococcus wingfieldii CBS 7118]
MPPPIIPSHSDLARQKLESTLANDLYSLSFSSIPTSTVSYDDPDESLEYPRGADDAVTYDNHDQHNNGVRRGDGMNGDGLSTYRGEASMFIGASPISTAGHHASAMTLGAGVFENGGDTSRTGEFDPERSLGRLVNELGKVMGNERMPERPTSPFYTNQSPTPVFNPLNLSFTLTRSNPLPSPPSSPVYQDHKPQAGQWQDTSLRDTRFARTPKAAGVHSSASQSKPTKSKSKASEKSNIKTPRAEGSSVRSVSAPVRGGRTMGDVTGLTDLLKTPARAGEYGYLNRDESVGGVALVDIPGNLEQLNERLKNLEVENTTSQRRMRELQDELSNAKEELAEAQKNGDRGVKEVADEKTALEQLVGSTQAHLSRLTLELDAHRAVIHKFQSAPPHPSFSPSSSTLANIRSEINRLSQQVSSLNSIVEKGLATCQHSRSERSVRMERQKMEKLVRQIVQDEQPAQQEAAPGPSKLRQGLRAAASIHETLAPATVQRPGPSKAERTFVRSEDMTYSPTPTLTRAPSAPSSRQPSGAGPHRVNKEPTGEIRESARVTLQRILGQAEEDYVHYKSIYVDLATRYKSLDPASDPRKRHIIAKKLKQAIGVLERKGDEVRDLRSLQ